MPMKVKGIKYFVIWELLCQVELYPVFRHTFHLLVMKRTSFLKLLNFQIFKEYEIYEIFLYTIVHIVKEIMGSQGTFTMAWEKIYVFQTKSGKCMSIYCNSQGKL